MIEIGVICPSHSPWASLVILVGKKDRKLHFCIDLRKLNVCMIKDPNSFPRIEETLDCLNETIWFIVLDLRLGQDVKMNEASKPLMAFTVDPLGFYECDHMLFGLANAHATFQRLIETCLGDLQLNWCLIYLNDIIMFCKTPKDHLVQLRAVFQKLKEVGLKLKTSKCEYFNKSLTYLRHKILE